MRFHPYRAPILLPAALLLSGCAELFLSAEERARRREALAMVERVGVLGASLSAGFGTGRTLADILDAAIRPRHEVIDASDPFFFRDPAAAGQRSAALLGERMATCVVALDYLFWFVHGKKTGERRKADLEEGLCRIEALGCPVFLGDLPDMRGAAADMLPRESIPPPEELAALNARIEVMDSLELRMGIDNLFDRKPPRVGVNTLTTGRVGAYNSASGQTDPGAYDVVGRTFFVGATLEM